MKALLKNYKQSPRKVRLIANELRGKKVVDALRDLSFMDKRASAPIHKLITSAVVNAKNVGKNISDLKINNIVVNSGIVFQGRRRVKKKIQLSTSKTGFFAIIKKRSSHIKIELI